MFDKVENPSFIGHIVNFDEESIVIVVKPLFVWTFYQSNGDSTDGRTGRIDVSQDTCKS